MDQAKQERILCACKGHISDKEVVGLFDPGSEHDVINDSVVHDAKILVEPMSPIPMIGFHKKLCFSLTSICNNVPLVIHDTIFACSFVVANLACCDALLGIVVP